MNAAQHSSTASVSDRSYLPSALPTNESLTSGVSWGAVIGGAFVTAAVGLLLMTLGAGMGLSSISIWPSARGSLHPVASGAVVWIILVQLLAGALGGYLAGRLRTKWVSVHTHEVYFRDTAHGLLVWAVSFVLSSAFLGALATSVAGDLAGRSAEAATRPADYYADALLRSTTFAVPGATAEERAEASAVLARNLGRASFDPSDRTFLTALVAARTGLSLTEAERRVEMTAVNQRVAFEESRKAVAHSLYWLVVALLVGAFSASYAAIFGGRRRDFAWS
jgi:hypothetical protein